MITILFLAYCQEWLLNCGLDHIRYSINHGPTRKSTWSRGDRQSWGHLIISTCKSKSQQHIGRWLKKSSHDHAKSPQFIWIVSWTQWPDHLITYKVHQNTLMLFWVLMTSAPRRLVQAVSRPFNGLTLSHTARRRRDNVTRYRLGREMRSIRSGDGMERIRVKSVCLRGGWRGLTEKKRRTRLTKNGWLARPHPHPSRLANLKPQLLFEWRAEARFQVGREWRREEDNNHQPTP